MSAHGLAALGGALMGLGVFLGIWWLLPEPRPDLAAAVARWTAPTPVDSIAGQDAGRAQGWSGRWLQRLAARTAARSGLLLGAPLRDLQLVGRSVEQFVVQRLALAGLGMALPSLLWAFLTVAGVHLPFELPVVLGVGAAVALSLIPAAAVRDEARQARDEFGRATSAYLDLVAQERASGRSPVQALTEAAQIGDSWVFDRIQQALVHAPRVGITPWQALADLGEQVGVPELSDLASIVASAADGAAIYTTLVKKAAALRSAALAADQAEANAASEKLSLPVALLGVGFVLMVFYPAFTQLLEAGQ